MERNELIVAFDQLDSPGLYTSEVEVYGLSFLNRPVSKSCRLLAKPRYRDPSQKFLHADRRQSCKGDFRQTATCSLPGQILASTANNCLAAAFTNKRAVQNQCRDTWNAGQAEHHRC